MKKKKNIFNLMIKSPACLTEWHISQFYQNIILNIKPGYDLNMYIKL